MLLRNQFATKRFVCIWRAKIRSESFCDNSWEIAYRAAFARTWSETKRPLCRRFFVFFLRTSDPFCVSFVFFSCFTDFLTSPKQFYLNVSDLIWATGIVFFIATAARLIGTFWPKIFPEIFSEEKFCFSGMWSKILVHCQGMKVCSVVN